MKYEYHAYFAFALKDSTTQAYAIDYLVGKSPKPPLQWKEITFIKDDYARLEILAQALVTGHKESVRTGSRKDPTGLYYWIKHRSGKFLRNRSIFMHKIFATIPPLPDLSLFPPGSWVIQVHFTLRKPYISKDDVDLYVIDNPVKKEWVFKVPYVAPSQWKGALRAAMVRQLVEWWNNLPEDKRNSKGFATRRFSLVLLFGSEKGEEPGAIKGLAGYLDNVGGQTAAQEFRNLLRKYFSVRENEPIPHLSGNLHFFPTYFDRIGLEVINPHPRDTGAGKQPIYFECVPAGTEGVFTVLYVPQSEIDEKTSKKTLKAVAQGIKAMLTEYGFGAKTSSGYGVAELSYTSPKSIIVEPKEYENIVSKIWED